MNDRKTGRSSMWRHQAEGRPSRSLRYGLRMFFAELPMLVIELSRFWIQYRIFIW
jgi:hypothetical protein